MSDTAAPAPIRSIAGRATGSPTGPTEQVTGSIGLQLLRSIIDNGSRAAFRDMRENLFVAAELPYFRFIDNHYRRHGVLPSLQTLTESNLRIVHAAPEPVGHYMDRIRQRAEFNLHVSAHPAWVRAVQQRDLIGARQVVSSLQASLLQVESQRDTFTLADTYGQVMEDYEVASRHPGRQGVTFGWAYFDQLTGGIENGDVATLAARPGKGKSWLMIHTAMAAWREGASVLFVTNEMTHRQIGRRMLGLHAAINPDGIRRGQLSEYARNIVYQTARDAATGAPFHLVSGTFKKSVPAVDACIQEFSPDLIVIDASYLLKPEGANSRMAKHELLGAVGEGIKQIAMARNRPIYQSLQLNRPMNSGRNPQTLDNLYGSDEFGQLTTTLLLVREGPPTYEDTRRTLTLGKNREGPATGEIQINFLFNPPNFEHLPTNENGDVITGGPAATVAGETLPGEFEEP